MATRLGEYKISRKTNPRVLRPVTYTRPMAATTAAITPASVAPTVVMTAAAVEQAVILPAVIEREQPVPAYKSSTTLTQRTLVEKVTYKHASQWLLPTGHRQVESVFKRYGDTKYLLIGYTDNSPDIHAGFNQNLATLRAESIRRKLIELGVTPNNIDATGLPLCCYVQSNDTSRGRRSNRRVEIFVN